MPRIAQVLLVISIFSMVVVAEEVVLLPSKDVSIYEGETNTANSKGLNLFSGATSAFKNGNLTRRALFAFDVASSIPSNATITEASLSLTVNKVPGGQQEANFGLFALTTPWIEGETIAGGAGGQGASQVGDDTTWTSTGIGEWTTPGGDFVSNASASASVGGRGTYTWSSEGMVADLQSWLTEPESNDGWILVVDGDPPTTLTAKRFASREHGDEASRPSLTIQFEASESLLGDYNGDNELTVADIGFVCTAINGGENPAEFDLNNDNIVNLDDLAVWVEDLKGTFLGDQDLSGSVDFADFLQLSNQFGFKDPQPEPNSSGWANGDFNCSAEIDFADFLILSTNFGKSNDQGAAVVPEPSTSLYALICLSTLALCRHRKVR